MDEPREPEPRRDLIGPRMLVAVAALLAMAAVVFLLVSLNAG